MYRGRPLAIPLRTDELAPAADLPRKRAVRPIIYSRAQYSAAKGGCARPKYLASRNDGGNVAAVEGGVEATNDVDGRGHGSLRVLDDALQAAGP